MKFFIDTADINEIRQALELGVLDGVTTNPSLVAKTGRPFRDVLADITQLVDGPISAEATAVDFEGICREAEELAGLHRNIVVKIPLTRTGLAAIKWCAGKGIRTNATLCFSPLQALLAAKAGATFVSPFVGRLDDVGHEGMEVVRQIRCRPNSIVEMKICKAIQRTALGIVYAFNRTAEHPVGKSVFRAIIADDITHVH